MDEGAARPQLLVPLKLDSYSLIPKEDSRRQISSDGDDNAIGLKNSIQFHYVKWTI